MVSTNDSRFLDPIYKTLDEGNAIVVQLALSRCAGAKYEYLIRNRKEFDSLRSHWSPQTIVTIGFSPKVVWEGTINSETTKVLNGEIEYRFCKDTEIYPLEDLPSLKGENVTIIEDVQWWKETFCACVPMPDGSVQLGAY